MTNPNDFLYPKMDKLKDVEDGAEIVYNHTPLTKREYFAAMAMQGIMAAKDAYHTYDYVVAWSVKLADALIEELNKSKDNGTD